MQTTALGFKKPEDTDNADLLVFVGDNMDLIDNAIQGKSATTHNHNIDELNKKVLTGSVTSASYYAFALTPINPVEYSAIFKITVTSTANASIGHVMYVRVEGHANTAPYFQVDSKTNNTTAGTTGLYYLRGVYPKTVGNGYAGYIELYCYDATKRDIKIELIDATNVSLMGSLTASTYNSTYQSTTTPAVCYNGVVTNGTFYGALSGTSTSSYYVYNDSFLAGEALVANDLIFLQTDNKWYKANVAGRTIPFGTVIGRCYSTYASGAGVGSYVYGRFALPAGVTGTVGKDMFIRGTITGGVFTSDGTITTTLTAGYSYIRIGSVVGNSTTYLYYDGNNRVYTLDASGNLMQLDGLPIEADSLGGVHLNGLMQTSHPANNITGLGSSGTSTLVSRDDHVHDTIYLRAYVGDTAPTDDTIQFWIDTSV